MIDAAYLDQLEAHLDEGGKVQPSVIMDLVNEIRRLGEALNNIAVTAQMASMHEPEQFCEWAYNAATDAIAQ
jgi:hypothetical protein